LARTDVHGYGPSWTLLAEGHYAGYGNGRDIFGPAVHSSTNNRIPESLGGAAATALPFFGEDEDYD
jgi:hypothetical protein